VGPEPSGPECYFVEVMNDTKPKRKECSCDRYAELTAAALSRLRFELGRSAINGLKKVTGEFLCDECDGTYWVSAKPSHKQIDQIPDIVV
jgi:hypothetical protein